MNKSKHTPGPWTVFSDSYGDRPGIEADAFSVVIYGYGEDDDGGVQGKSKEEELANAYLIAAAPDMLEALKNLENDDNHIPLEAWQMVQSAIAKATNQNQS
jgi:hypothetical protein